MKTIDQTNTSNSAIIVTDNLLSDISRHVVFVNEVQIFTASTTSIWYQLLEDTELRGRALIKVNNLTSGTCYIFSATCYTDPGIEFWKYDFEPAASDISLQGGEWLNGNNVTALATYTNDIITSGGAFMHPYNDFSPEELVPGHTTDSLGINVYTQFGETYATVLSGSFSVTATNTLTSYQISASIDSVAGYLVYFNNKIFQRSTTTNFTTSNQYFIQGKNIIIPPQSSSGTAGYSYVKIGGSGLIDDTTVYATSSTTIPMVIVESLASFDSVKSVYVLMDGQEVTALTTSSTSNFGYLLEKDWTTTNALNPIDNSARAAVRLYNVPSGEHVISAWYFSIPDVKFNKIKEDFYTVNGSQTVVLNSAIGLWQPFSDKVLVEIGEGSLNTFRRRLTPPKVSNYIIKDYQTVFSFFDDGHVPSSTYDPTDVIVYANGSQIRSGYDFNFDFTNNRIILHAGLFPNGTSISILNKKRESGNLYDYIINDNILRFEPSPLTNKSVKVTTFSTHDNLFMETEIFNWNPSRRFTFIRSILDDNYIWVYIDGIPLVHGIDFRVLSDLRTVEISYDLTITGSPTVVITSIKRPDIPNKVYGYRIFNDFYNRTSYKRLSKDHTTFLTELLSPDDSNISINEESKLSPVNAAKNIPGVVLIDRERIEFFGRSDNLLTELRRGTGGTSPAPWSEPSTKVIDQGILQSIPSSGDMTYVYTTSTTNTSTYLISTFNTQTGQGINLDNQVPAHDQITVYLGGKPLNKSSRLIYETVTSTELITIGPEFSITTSTQALELNIGDRLIPGLTLTVTHRKGRIWTGTESILTSEVRQAKFIRQKEAELPDVYFYGGDPRLLDENYVPISNEFNEIIRIE